MNECMSKKGLYTDIDVLYLDEDKQRKRKTKPEWDLRYYAGDTRIPGYQEYGSNQILRIRLG